jgi:rhamnopyranosyl-N-acetylglucosaminyl-diphospho-decaprenol beta-1,3/1,4-galactofuranosyltransferase
MGGMTSAKGAAAAGDARPPPPDGVTAVVLTHLRPRLAGDVVRGLVEHEGLDPGHIVVVVNGPGGLDDPQLEDAVRMVRLPRNTGPAGGFRAGLVEAFTDPATRWAYLCEDDVGLFDLPSPRLADLLERVASPAPQAVATTAPVGAVVAYGRVFIGRGAHTVNVVPEGPGDGLAPVDVACWGATLVSRAVVDAGVLPDPAWFFGLEDFDFFCRVREAGFGVLLDEVAARRVAEQQTNAGRDAAIRDRRPTDTAEAWRAYYHARNSFALARRHGRPSWMAWHFAYSARHLQKAHSGAERAAILHGLWDGVRGRMGENPRYRREVGELGPGVRSAPAR